MPKISEKNPLPPCPATPNCIRTSEVYQTGLEMVYEAFIKVFDEESYRWEVIDPKRIELHAVYRIPVFGFKDDVDVIMEEAAGTTTVFIRSASRVGAYDLGVNQRRVKRILKKAKLKIKS
ncbi:MAG: DUF1499 domain-containing protein [Gracilimonas sp.]|uniref:DUF1499 domain-containing protein n=1 Tax=Gracilimonas TaxID=649462 RepID=UPI001B1A2BA4|nr:DUF1499 domain-containing protein [Gracilimonas sp.]MBO6587038.1 DUF1499 domain-containing protein [Gracilimonas sp.]MBO6614474.1 DUF1499 domain-containing protein [Gracilimonas sp.]